MTQAQLPLRSRQLFHFIALAAVLITVTASYPIAATFNNKGWLPQSYLGNLVVGQYVIASAAMFIAWYFSPKSQSLSDFKWLLFIAIIARLFLIPVDVYTSNDIDRYLFDGRLWWEGFDPYRVNHQAPELQELRALWGPPDEHAAYVTIYPPLALSLFTLAASTGVEWAPIVWKVMGTAANIAVVIISALVLRNAGKLHHVALVALSPILIFETGIGAHLDIFSLLAISLALFAWQSERFFQCGVWIAMGTLIKFLPAVVAMPLFFSARNHKQRIVLTLSVVCTIIIGYLMIIAAGLHPIGSLVVFFEKWRFGSPLFNTMATFFNSQTLPIITGLCLIVGMGLVALYVVFGAQQNREQRTFSAIQVALVLPLLLSPVVFPWYLTPIVLIFALAPRLYLAAWLTLMPLTYEVLGPFICCGKWAPADWPLWVISGGLVVGLLYDIKQKPLITLQRKANIG